MKSISRLFTPTSNKRLNELVGFLFFVSATLLFLALASYSPIDPSLNTSATPPSGSPAHNWIGVFGAFSSDMLLQFMGIAAFLLPVVIAILGLRWFRTQKVESWMAKTFGVVALTVFFSSFLALLPWNWRWLKAVPIEGLMGRIVGDALIHYLNVAGAYIVSLAAIAVALYMATAFSFGAMKLWAQTRFTFFYALRDRYFDWRERREKLSAQKELEKKRKRQEEERAAAAVVARRPAAPAQDPLTARIPAAAAQLEAAAARPVAAPKSGIERMMEEAAPAPVAAAAAPIAPITDLSGIAVTSRADAEKTAKTTMPKVQGGWKLPSTTLLHRPDERNEFDEDELK